MSKAGNDFVTRTEFAALAELIAATVTNNSRLEARVSELTAQVANLTVLLLTGRHAAGELNPEPHLIPSEIEADKADVTPLKFEALEAGHVRCTQKHAMVCSSELPGPYSDYGWSCKICGDSSGVQWCERWFCSICEVLNYACFVITILLHIIHCVCNNSKTFAAHAVNNNHEMIKTIFCILIAR